MTNFVEMRGNIFASASEVITITVNCVGIMGAGIALDAQYRWPRAADEYANACAMGQISIGKIFWASPSHQKLAFFPTKTQWQLPTKIIYVEKGLKTLRTEIIDRSISSLALPHLGCSNGGLNWSDVKPIVLNALSEISGLKVELWEFDANFSDEDFVRFKQTFMRLNESVAAEWLMCSKSIVRRLQNTLSESGATNFIQFSSIKGIGKKTIAKVYRAALRSEYPPFQGSFGYE